MQATDRLQISIQWHHSNLDNLMVARMRAGGLKVNSDHEVSIEVDEGVV
jgi:hypothetical protein